MRLRTSALQQNNSKICFAICMAIFLLRFSRIKKTAKIVKLHSAWSLNKWWLLGHTLQKSISFVKIVGWETTAKKYSTTMKWEHGYNNISLYHLPFVVFDSFCLLSFDRITRTIAYNGWGLCEMQLYGVFKSNENSPTIPRKCYIWLDLLLPFILKIHLKHIQSQSKFCVADYNGQISCVIYYYYDAMAFVYSSE